jgi:6-pyruvoyltetrahydropterin/6-carboxytetrahydropterin synthase
MTRVTRRYKFVASHRLHSPDLTEAQNAELYGKCNNPFGHGHNYALEVSVRGAVDEATGRVVDLGALDAYVDRQIIQAFDHRDMNQDVAVFRDVVPTTENLSREIDRRLREQWTFRATLDGVRIRETERNLFELRES